MGVGRHIIGYSICESCTAPHEVTLIDPMSLANDALVAVLSNMGAPLVGSGSIQLVTKLVRIMEHWLGRTFEQRVLEIGGGNGLHPLMVAAVTGYPVVDADTMGRACPKRKEERRRRQFAVLPAGTRRYPRQRGHHSAGRKLAMDGADQPQGLHRGWLHRLDLQGAAQRPRSQGTCDPLYHDAGDRPRPRGDGGARRSHRSRRGDYRERFWYTPFRRQGVRVDRRTTDTYVDERRSTASTGMRAVASPSTSKTSFPSAIATARLSS